MRPTRLLALLLAAATLMPAAAFAHRRATRAQRSAILAAIVRQGQLTKAQAACQKVTISTVNSSYATSTWPKKLSKACMQVAANGVIIEHRTKRGWGLVADGSSFKCPIRHLPAAVARDLGVCP